MSKPLWPNRPPSPSPCLSPPESPQPRRYLALWFPFLPAERWRRDHPAAGPEPLVLAVRHKGALRLAALGPEAAALGLAPGLGVAAARARFPTLRVEALDAAGDAALLNELAAQAEEFSPLFAIDPPHGLMLDVTGCAHLFGGEEALRRAAVTRFAARGLTVRATLARTAAMARGLSRWGRAGTYLPSTDEKAARALPVAALELAPEVVRALERAGLRTVSDLACRPRATLSARFGEGLMRHLHRVLGHEDIRITPLRPEAPVSLTRRFAEPTGHPPAIMAALAALVAEAETCLEQRGAGGQRFELVFFRSDGQRRRLALDTAAPCRSAKTLLRLITLRLDTLHEPLEAGFGFDAIRLDVVLALPLGQGQPDLSGVEAPEADFAELVSRLATRFGRGRVLRLVPCDSHDPVRAMAVVTHLSPVAAAAWPVAEAGEPPLRPLTLFEPPQRVEAMAQVPDGPPLRFRWHGVLHEVALFEGPERIAPEWWRGEGRAAPHDYYRVEDRHGRRFWLYREGDYAAPLPPRWFVHGLFP